MKRIIAIALPLVLVGCVTIPDEITTEQRDFTYDYAVANKSQKELFKAARNYFATAYGNSKEVSRVEDEDQGTIIGKAVAEWQITEASALMPRISCYSNYNIIFIAKDGKARLQLTLLEGAMPPCNGWRLPSKFGYSQITNQFQGASKGLGNALNGHAAIDKLKNF